MTIGKAIRYILINDAAVAALISDRVYPLVAPQAAQMPYITYAAVGTNEHGTKGGVSKVDQIRIQIDIVADNESTWNGYDSAMEINDAVRTALDRYAHGAVGSTGVTLDGVSFIDEETGYEEKPNRIKHIVEYYFRQKYS